MGLQPIDLQVMYSQSSNVSKTAAGQQQAMQLSESMQQTKIIQQNLENATRVQETSSDKAKSQTINEDGSGGGSSSGQKKKSKDDSEPEKNQQSPFTPIRESYLGTIIDITR